MDDLRDQRPLTFVVVGRDGTVVATFTEDDLVSGHSWREAACWAYLAWIEHERRHASVTASRPDGPEWAGVPSETL